MPVKIIPSTPSAYACANVRAPDQEMAYRDLRRRSYREFRERIGRLTSGLTKIGVEQDVVAILEWDSDCYHASCFAIPMMGAVMQTVKVQAPSESSEELRAHA